MRGRRPRPAADGRGTATPRLGPLRRAGTTRTPARTPHVPPGAGHRGPAVVGRSARGREAVEVVDAQFGGLVGRGQSLVGLRPRPGGERVPPDGELLRGRHPLLLGTMQHANRGSVQGPRTPAYPPARGPGRAATSPTSDQKTTTRAPAPTRRAAVNGRNRDAAATSKAVTTSVVRPRPRTAAETTERATNAAPTAKTTAPESSNGMNHASSSSSTATGSAPDSVAASTEISMAGSSAKRVLPITTNGTDRALHRHSPRCRRAPATARNASVTSGAATATTRCATDHRVTSAVSAAATASLSRRSAMNGWYPIPASI